MQWFIRMYDDIIEMSKTLLVPKVSRHTVCSQPLGSEIPVMYILPPGQMLVIVQL